MRKMLWLFTFISVLSMGCNRTRWTNQIDSLALECGVSDGYSSETALLLKFDSFAIAADKRDLEAYKVTDANAMEPLDFELTPKHCLKLNRKEITSSQRVAVIFKQRQAAEFMPNDFNKPIVTAQLNDCGSYCSAFPLCGLITGAEDEGSSKSVFKLQVPEGTKVNVSIESDFVSRSLEINVRQCFVVSRSRSGNIKIQDANGNFFEESIEKIVAQSVRNPLPVETLTLRGPFTDQEKMCKLDPVHYRMDGVNCVPKTFRYYCEDSPAHASVIGFSNFFLKKDCARIEEFLVTQSELEFAYKNISEVEVFSGLENIKRLNLSGNKIPSLHSMRGLNNLDSLIISGNLGTFDVSSIAQFEKLKSLDISNTSISNIDRMPEMDSIEELKISADSSEILSKFRGLKRLHVEGGSRLDLSKIVSKNLQSLSIFTVAEVVDLKSLAMFKELESLKLEFVGSFKGTSEFPEISSLEDLTLSFVPFSRLDKLAAMPRLRELKLETNEPIFSSGILPKLDQIKILHYLNHSHIDLGWLTVFANLEELSLIGKLDSFESMPMLPFLSTLNLKEAELKSLKGLQAKNIHYLAIRDALNQLDLNDLPVLSNLETLVFEAYGIENSPASDISWLLKVPKLRYLSLDINSKQKNLEDFLPKELEELYLNSVDIQSLDFLGYLPRLGSLSLSLNDSILNDSSKIVVPALKYLRISTKSENFGFLPEFQYADQLRLDGSSLDEVITKDAAVLLANKFGGTRDLSIDSAFQDVSWIERFLSLETLRVSTLLQSFNQFPELPSLSALVINDAAKMKDLSGVEKFPKLEVIDFSQNSNFSSLANLAKLSELREIKNGRRLRGGLVDEGSCPEGIEAPWGLRDFCRNLQVPFGTNLGPLPF